MERWGAPQLWQAGVPRSHDGEQHTNHDKMRVPQQHEDGELLNIVKKRSSPASLEMLLLCVSDGNNN